jgi:hypothetical protein
MAYAATNEGAVRTKLTVKIKNMKNPKIPAPRASGLLTAIPAIIPIIRMARKIITTTLKMPYAKCSIPKILL